MPRAPDPFITNVLVPGALLILAFGVFWVLAVVGLAGLQAGKRRPRPRE